MYTVDSAIELAPAPSDDKPKVAILMGTFNGQRFLPEQLDSIKRQTHTNWELHVSDDGSSDSTLDIINSIRKEWPDHQVTLRQGPQKGFVANFLSLACDPNIKADYYAFSDQDDVWESDKLERAITWLQSIPADKPAMYCSRTRLIDESGKSIGFSPLFKRKPSFKNALVQSIAGANTMVFNNSARTLLAKAGYEIPIVSHDWWVYMLATGCGGEVFYDLVPSIGYRQHGKNLVGSNVGWAARQRRIVASFRGRFARWNDTNICALTSLNVDLTPENCNLMLHFKLARKSASLLKPWRLIRMGIHRQTIKGNIQLILAAALNKI